jgi:hypothetical protein
MKSRAHLGLEEGVLKLVAALDSEGCLKPVGSANVPSLGVGKAAAAERVLVEKVSLFP